MRCQNKHSRSSGSWRNDTQACLHMWSHGPLQDIWFRVTKLVNIGVNKTSGFISVIFFFFFRARQTNVGYNTQLQFSSFAWTPAPLLWLGLIASRMPSFNCHCQGLVLRCQIRYHASRMPRQAKPTLILVSSGMNGAQSKFPHDSMDLYKQWKTVMLHIVYI